MVTAEREAMAMRDRGVIIVGLVVFLVLVTFPVWYTLVEAGDAALPAVELPQDGSRCVEDAEYMTANHMDVLNQWRDAVVRNGEKHYTSMTSGEQYEMSLTRTCMKCHSNRETFCDRCHDFAGVAPTCFDCHVEPRGN